MAMKIDRLIVGLLVIVVAALLLADGIMGYVDPSIALFSIRGFKLAVGFVLVVLAASYFRQTKE